MTVGLSRIGEEFLLDYVFTDGATRPASILIGLYNDSVDSLSEVNDLSDITTEPSGSTYSRQVASFPNDFINTFNGVSNNWEVVVESKVFDATDSSQIIDSYFMVINFDSNEASDGGVPTDHIFFTGNLDQTYDLSGISIFTANNLGVSFNTQGN